MTAQATGERRLIGWLLLAAIAAAALVVRHRGGSSTAARAALDPWRAVPAGPELLITADVERLIATAGPELLRAGAGKLLGLRELCGFEPLLSLRRVALATPFRAAGQDSADFALIAETSLEPESVLRCAEAVIRKRGGTPVRSLLGAFGSVRDQKKPLGEVAIRADGLFVFSGGQYFRDVVDAAAGAATGDAAARLRSRLHESIRRKLGSGQLAVTLLSGSLLPEAGVEVVGLSLALGRDVTLRGFVGCASVAACSSARGVLERLRADAVREPALADLASISLVQHDAQLEIAGHVSLADLGPLFAQLAAP